MKDKEKQKAYARSIRGRYTDMKSRSKQRGYETDISIEQYTKLVTSPCFYCWGKLDASGTGLDRLDETKGYLYSNVITCCGECNRIKSNKYSPDQMIKIAQVLRMLKWENGS